MQTDAFNVAARLPASPGDSEDASKVMRLVEGIQAQEDSLCWGSSEVSAE